MSKRPSEEDTVPTDALIITLEAAGLMPAACSELGFAICTPVQHCFCGIRCALQRQSPRGLLLANLSTDTRDGLTVGFLGCCSSDEVSTSAAISFPRICYQLHSSLYAQFFRGTTHHLVVILQCDSSGHLGRRAETTLGDLSPISTLEL